MSYGYAAFSCRDFYLNFSLFLSVRSMLMVHPGKHLITKREKEEQFSAAWNSQGKERLLAALPGSSAVTWYRCGVWVGGETAAFRETCHSLLTTVLVLETLGPYNTPPTLSW